jgi:hypothetical protein
MRNVTWLILITLLISVILVAGCTSLVGHKYEVRGQYYDFDPSVPLIQQNPDVVGAIIQSGGNIKNYNDYQDLYNQYNYQCISLKNEGTAAFTTAQSAAAGTSSTEQLLNYYSMAKDAIQREENCQASIRVIQEDQLSLAVNQNIQINSDELNQNMQISQSDESKEIANYNSIASSFNNAVISCHNDNQVLGNDGLCHDIREAPNIYFA